MMRLALTLIALAFATPALAQLAPFKDRLFGYPAILETRNGGREIVVDYDKRRDIIGRDAVPRRKAKGAYVDTWKVRWARKVISFPVQGGSRKAFAVGARRNAKVTVIYVHGKGGNRRQGVSDVSFGGNFNRLQNLMVRNGGLLLTPDVVGFGRRGTEEIAALIAHARRGSPRGRIVLACGSMGGRICWALLGRPVVAGELSGVVLLGAQGHEPFLKSAEIRKDAAGVPITMAIGGSDQVFDPATQIGFFRRLVKRAPRYPARLIVFRTGVHGTPIRMIDWRVELNRLLSS